MHAWLNSAIINFITLTIFFSLSFFWGGGRLVVHNMALAKLCNAFPPFLIGSRNAA